MTEIEHRTRKNCGPVYILNSTITRKDCRCIECRRTLSCKGHFSKIKRKCSTCSFETNCRFSYLSHLAGHNHRNGCSFYSSAFKRREALMDRYYECFCGFSTMLGNNLAKHMVECPLAETISALKDPEGDKVEVQYLPNSLCKALDLRLKQKLPNFETNDNPSSPDNPSGDDINISSRMSLKSESSDVIGEHSGDTSFIQQQSLNRMRLSPIKKPASCKSENGLGATATAHSGCEVIVDKIPPNSASSNNDCNVKSIKKASSHICPRDRMTFFSNAKNRLKKAEHVIESITTVCEQYDQKRSCKLNQDVLRDVLLKANEIVVTDKRRMPKKNCEIEANNNTMESPVVIDLTNAELASSDNDASATPSPNVSNLSAMNLFETMEQLLYADTAGQFC